MAERIGLEAVLDLGNWSSGIKTYMGNLSEMSSRTVSAASSISSQFVGLGQGVLKFGAIAGGAALVGIGALTAGLVVLGGQAMTEYAKYERLSLSITNLVAREISQGQVVEQQRQTMATLTKKEADELQNLTLKIQEEGLERQTMLGRIQEQKQRIIDLTAAYGDNGLNVQTAKAKLAEMEFELTKSDAATASLTERVNELNSKNGQMVTTLEKVRVGQMSMADAMVQAGPRAQELLKWIQLLAVQSPFTQEGIASAFQTALAYGFTSEQAQRLTQAEVDFAAATGKGVEATNLIALALGQMQAKGKVSGQEIIQLTNAGVGVNKILSDMGFTLDDVSKGLVDSDKFIEAVITDMEIFKGSAKAQANTFSGLISTMEDLKSIGLREFFTGTFKAVQPYLASFVGLLTDAALTSGKLRAIGDVLGGVVARSLKTIAGLMGAFQTSGTAGLVAALGITPDALLLFDKVSALFTTIGTTISSVLAPAFASLSDPLSLINTVISFLNLHFEEFKGALLGIGAVLAAGVFAALVAAVLSLLTPINLIIAGAALLGAAWAGNWGDIQGKTAAAWAVLQPILQQLWDWLEINIPLAIQTASAFWSTTLLPALQAVGNFITTVVVPAWLNLWTWLNTNIPAAIQTVSGFWTGTLLPAITAVGDYINGTAVPFFAALGNVISAIVNKAVEAGAGLWQNVLYPALTAVGNYISATLSPVFQAIGDYLSATFGPTANELGGVILPAIKIGFDGIVTAIQSATTWLNDLAGKITALQLPPWLTPGSPTPFEMGLLGIAMAVQGPLLAAFTTFGPIVVAALALLQQNTTAWDMATQNIYLVTLPTLQAVVIATAAAIAAAIDPLSTSTMPNLANATGVAAAAFGTLGKTGATAGKDIASAMDDARGKLAKLADFVSTTVVEAFNKMKEAAQQAADAANNAGSASGARTGLGFAGGTGPAGFLVPPGYPNDSYPLRVQSGERVMVAPRGQSIEELIAPRMITAAPVITTNYYFDMTVNTGASASAVMQQFEVMRAMTG